ncbi:MAG: ATP-binding protein [Candidatus Hinthialibacter antarcticus]|nr:ATP-binding protein [Candidatus Hinthialibacter antarcticus]
MKSGFLKKILDRADKIDKHSILDYLKQIVQERDLMVLIFDNMREGMIFVDDDEMVVYVNQSARTMLRLGDGSATPFVALPKLLGSSSLYSFCQGLIETGETSAFEDYTLHTRDEIRFLKINCLPLRNAGELFGTLYLFLDETEQTIQEEKLRKAEKLAALTTLSAGVSHEIRNPLNALSIHLQLLKRQLKKNGNDSEDIDKTINVFQTEITRLNDVIETFLTAVRPSQPEMKLTPLYDLITETLTLMRPEFLQHAIQIMLYEDGEWPLVQADADQLKQAFINLFRNAIDAITEQSAEERETKENRIVLRMSRSDDRIRLTFADDGGGMNSEDARRIFEPYFTTKPKGTGLGLMIVDRIIREHNGTVNAVSETGEGTQIAVELPIAAERPKRLQYGEANVNEF